MHAPPGTPMHCIQLWSCQIDVISGAILQEGFLDGAGPWLLGTGESLTYLTSPIFFLCPFLFL